MSQGLDAAAFLPFKLISGRAKLTELMTFVVTAIFLVVYWLICTMLGLDTGPIGWIVTMLLPAMVTPIVTWVIAGLVMDLRSSNSELIRSYEEVEYRALRRKEMLRLDSHALGAPVAAIQMIGSPPETCTNSREQMSEAASTMRHFFERLRSAISLGWDYEAKIERFSLLQLRDDVNFLGSALASDQGANLNVIGEWPDDVGKLFFEADYMRFCACIMDLVRNALVHAQAKEVLITVRGGALQEGRIPIYIAVEGDGGGISAGKIYNLLRPAELGDQENTGSEFDLNIVHDWLYEFDRGLDVDCEKGKGTRFSFSVGFEPVASCEADDSHPALVSTAVNARNSDALTDPRDIVILLVEDHKMTREICEKLLDNVFGRIFTAEDGPTALELLNIEEIDLLISDHSMPGMNGPEMIRRAYANGFRGRSVGLSATDDGKVVGDFVKSGCDLVMLKPLNVKKLALALAPEPD